ncbi:hypothetical protein ACE106_07440 [Shouchella clausii]|uniref:hypothetical protein n=1 Tax=Shouchella clausii TaxID=79880 RepID=UPI00289E5AB1|nr:hypothetical protein [Shouchella clausii]
MARITKKEQDANERISAEIARLNGIFKDLSEDKKEVALRLIERVAFMTITLENLEKEVKKKGPVYTFVNGSQKMTIEHPAQKSYNAMIQRYTAAYDKLFNLLPKDDPRNINTEDNDGFDDFVRRRE